MTIKRIIESIYSIIDEEEEFSQQTILENAINILRNQENLSHNNQLRVLALKKRINKEVTKNSDRWNTLKYILNHSGTETFTNISGSKIPKFTPPELPPLTRQYLEKKVITAFKKWFEITLNESFVNPNERTLLNFQIHRLACTAANEIVLKKIEKLIHGHTLCNINQTNSEISKLILKFIHNVILAPLPENAPPISQATRSLENALLELYVTDGIGELINLKPQALNDRMEGTISRVLNQATLFLDHYRPLRRDIEQKYPTFNTLEQEFQDDILAHELSGVDEKHEKELLGKWISLKNSEIKTALIDLLHTILLNCLESQFLNRLLCKILTSKNDEINPLISKNREGTHENLGGSVRNFSLSLIKLGTDSGLDRALIGFGGNFASFFDNEIGAVICNLIESLFNSELLRQNIQLLKGYLEDQEKPPLELQPLLLSLFDTPIKQAPFGTKGLLEDAAIGLSYRLSELIEYKSVLRIFLFKYLLKI